MSIPSADDGRRVRRRIAPRSLSNGLYPEERWAGDIATQLEDALLDLAEEYRGAEVRLPNAQDVANLLVNALPAPPSELGSLVGPFYDTHGTRAFLGLEAVGLERAVLAGEVLVVTMRNGPAGFPVWQFDPAAHRVRAELLRTLRTLSPLNGWTSAMWFMTANEDLDGRRPLDAAVEDEEAVVALAQRFVGALSR